MKYNACSGLKASGVISHPLSRSVELPGTFLLMVARANGIDCCGQYHVGSGRKHTTTCPKILLSDAKSLQKMRELACRGSPAVPARISVAARLSQERQSRRCGPCRTLNILDQPPESISFGKPTPLGASKTLLRGLCHALSKAPHR